MVMLNFECQRCGECCKRYYIVSLPEEVAKQATFLGLTEEEFIEKHTQLFLQLFPANHNTEKIMVSSSLVPKKFSNVIEGHLGYTPDFFISLPVLAFKRREVGECTFYDSKNSGCTIYAARPAECRMFPFISDKKVDDYSKLYPFCHGLKLKSEKVSYVDLGYIHFNQMSEYFGKVKENGFSSMWKSWPKEGVLLFEDKLVGKINEKEFFEVIEPFK